MIEVIGPNDSDDAIRAAIDEAIANGWIIRISGVLSASPAGRDIFRIAADVQQELEIERRQGISDTDYVTTIRTLQRTIENVGGSAWHW
ncbi:hypothetical protein AAFP30_05935 [Gordonia sp. CPCC 205515]|uniref:hypothetical protein n=1 Tax=Gordonia sp. CPCC 205515 TaxID=3140791 RepID=UPI003AF379B8